MDDRTCAVPRTRGHIKYPSFSICIKFSRDLIYIPRNFLKFQQRNAWLGETGTPEHFHIRTLGRLLDPESVCKIQHISVSTPPKGPYNFGDWRELYNGEYPWWRGEGLTLFRRGSLRSVHLFSMKRSHLLWAKLQVEDYLQHYWVETDLKKRKDRLLRSRRSELGHVCCAHVRLDGRHLHVTFIS